MIHLKHFGDKSHEIKSLKIYYDYRQAEKRNT
jgi:hypothetical protein